MARRPLHKQPLTLHSHILSLAYTFSLPFCLPPLPAPPRGTPHHKRSSVESLAMHRESGGSMVHRQSDSNRLSETYRQSDSVGRQSLSQPQLQQLQQMQQAHAPRQQQQQSDVICSMQCQCVLSGDEDPDHTDTLTRSSGTGTQLVEPTNCTTICGNWTSRAASPSPPALAAPYPPPTSLTPPPPATRPYPNPSIAVNTNDTSTIGSCSLNPNPNGSPRRRGSAPDFKVHPAPPSMKV